MWIYPWIFKNRCTNCPSGYTGNGAIGCVDINECEKGGCDPLVTCTNTIGGYNCSKVRKIQKIH